MTDPCIPVFFKDLPPHIRGFCCLGIDYEPCIIINSRMTAEQQRKTYRHELRHILRGDMFNDDYVEYGS